MELTSLSISNNNTKVSINSSKQEIYTRKEFSLLNRVLDNREN